jgi:hypothetical protein
MNLSFGERTEVIVPDGSYAKQVGKVHIPPGQELTIYYPAPYTTPPNLVISDTWHDCRIVEQRADGFVVRNPAGTPREIEWTARGTRPATATTSVNVPAGSAIVPTAASTIR